MNGWTPTIPQDEQRRNELAALRELVVSDPDNEYWWNRLIALEAEIEADVIAHWFDESHITVRSNPALLGGVRYQKPTTSTERARSISLDGGKLRPYSSFPRRRGVVVNLEDEKIHDWQWESWII